MAIAFDESRWREVKESARQWWAGELERPLIQVRLHGRDAGRPEPDTPSHGFWSFYNPTVTAGQIVDRADYNLSRIEYLGDAFPTVWPNFGPGVLAAFLGARLENGENTAWFLPDRERDVAELDFVLDPANEWLERVASIYQEGAERWGGLVQMGMTDLGGSVDVLSTFRPGEGLLLDLHDDPASVKQRTWELHELWFAVFGHLDRIVRPAIPGYTSWTPLFSEESSYMLQCDFCFMIGPDMFDEFVKPELTAACQRMVNPFYHLDGPGELPHLSSLLAIDELKGVQWIPGSGAPEVTEWPEVYRQIRDAGKLIQVFGAQSERNWRALDVLAEQLGEARGVCLIADAPASERDEVLEFLKRYGL
jgi:5-methyltetrahydrofolate--homocysteine methyltransferase